MILDLLRQRRLVKTGDLAEQLAVSDETIRRDLERLERQGLVRRVHGGATVPAGTGLEPPYDSRAAINIDEKQRIGAVAASMVSDGDTLLIDIGTTTLEFAKCLRDKRDLTVLTNSMPTALELSTNSSAKVYLLGGLVRQGELSLSGFLTEAALKEFFVDKAFVGAGGLSAIEGLTDYHVAEAQVRRTMVARAREVIVLADHTKFGAVALTMVVPLRMIHKIITDGTVTESDIQTFAQQGVEVIVVGE